MTARKFAVSFPEELHERAHQAAEAAGTSLSAWLSQAAEHELTSMVRCADGLAAIAEFEADHGPITAGDADRAWVAEVIASATRDQQLAG